MRYPYRCNRCRTRFSTHRRREQYVREPRCPCCRSDSYHFDHDEWTKRNRRPCTCDGRHFPHRRGSLGCEAYDGPRDLELEAELGIQESVRGGDVPPF